MRKGKNPLPGSPDVSKPVIGQFKAKGKRRTAAFPLSKEAITTAKMDEGLKIFEDALTVAEKEMK